MKPSHIFLISSFLVLFLVSKIPYAIIGSRLSRDDWKKTEDVACAHLVYSESDPIRLEAPPASFKWFAITLGIDPHEPKDRRERQHIFSDLGLILIAAVPSYQIHNRFELRSPIKPLNRKILQILETRNGESDTGKLVGGIDFIFAFDPKPKTGGPNFSNKLIFIEILKTFGLPEITQDTSLKDLKQGARGKNGKYWEYEPYGNEALGFYLKCGWQKGLWKTKIDMNSHLFDGDLDSTKRLRDSIRDRILAYYRSLHSISQ